MRILLSTVTYYPTVGGADDFARSIAEGLAERGHDVAVATSDLLQHVSGKKLEDARDMDLNGVRIMRGRSFNVPGHIYPLWPSLKGMIRRFNPDVIHAFNLGYFSVDGAAYFSRGLPLVVSPTGGRYRQGRLYSPMRAIFRPHVESAGLWTALSESERRSLRKDHPAAPAMELLAPSIVPEEWRLMRDDPFSTIPRGFRILFAGRLSVDKGVGDLVSAFEKVRSTMSAELLIVGPNYGYEIPKTPPAGVHFIGTVERDALIAAYQHCDLFVLPSSHEGFGIVLIEAMAAGKPVVAYDNSSMPELARDGINGRVVPTGDVDSLAAAIMEFSDPKLRARMGASGRSIVMAEFSRTAMIDRTVELYRRVLAHS